MNLLSVSSYFLIGCLSLMTYRSGAQSYNYAHFDVQEGLAASTVYCMIQDRDGFMWFGTETGLSRFDGGHFTTFTTKDGLPDNEILKMYEDSKGRLWMIPFRNSICYYYKGKFYNPGNDSLLKKIEIKDRILELFETKDGTIWMNELNHYFKVSADGKVQKLDHFGSQKVNTLLLFQKDKDENIIFSEFARNEYRIYSYKDKEPVFKQVSSSRSYQNSYCFTTNKKVWIPKDERSGSRLTIQSPYTNSIDTIHFPRLDLISSLSDINDSLISINSPNGAQIYNLKTGSIEYEFLSGEYVNGTTIDNEGNMWFITLGKGVYRLKNANFKLPSIPDLVLKLDDIYSINIYGKEIIIGLDKGRICSYKLSDPGSYKMYSIDYNKGFSKILGVLQSGTKRILVTDFFLRITDKNYKPIKLYWQYYVKDYYLYNDTLYIATNINVLSMSLQDMHLKGTLWNGRATAVFKKRDSLFIRTLRGLYLIKNGKTEYWGERNSFFQGRISDINESDDGSLWVATYDNGIARFKNGRILKHYTDENGLTSNICRTLTMGDGSVWLGTDKGITRIRYDGKDREITRITESDGLSSDYINRIVVSGDTIFAATSHGLTYFNRTMLNQYSECKLSILNISGDKLSLNRDSSYHVGGRRLAIDFAGISFKSGGEITYRYRLKGVNNTWQTTKENSLEFVSLPYGSYSLELVAENKFGVISDIKSIRLNVPVPFWKSLGFYTLVVAAIGIFIFLAYTRRLNAIRKREKEKTSINKKIADMELKALRAQMNPHFTFNVLNSIQYFISYNDTSAAQKYLSRFAKLIRMTLDNSRSVFIKLSDEIRIMELYLELEQMRFEKKFTYTIGVDESIETDKVTIPSMLIQPFIENAIKHGFKNTVDNPDIQLDFRKKAGMLECIITDNGVGRKKSAEIRQTLMPDHKSAGISMINDKVEALKYYYDYALSVEIVDIMNANKEPAGTRVVIRLPELNSKP